MRNLYPVVLLVLAANGTAQVRVANDGRANKVPVPRAGLSSQDRQFMKDASVANVFEIATSKVALSRARGPWAKQFAKEMIEEHTGAQNELGLVAKSKGIALPTGLPMRQQAIVAMLKNVDAAGFDEAYRKAQIDGHQQTSAKFGTEIKRGHDSAARNYAIKILPAVRMHLKLARLQKTMTGETKIQTNQ